ncbi:DHA2 family efflux MFS transporter permease subunit [uncultured Leifsonia sp.]|uniref:DHA2 family efflux MFS transporter permease subunit n=1 Tax=uncultured Leifsonia sp. TaxID=340359 RepID=UPI0025EDBA30|nr:DHA2 family efflux MFS transporter permease subunit [uncultured Leifsonia sp.]
MRTTRTRWLGLAAISVAVSLIIVDSTIVNVAIPSIVDDLQISSTQAQWVQEAYTLVFAALLIPFGTLGDRWGRRRLLVTGVAVFTLASIAAGLSVSGPMLIAARVAQGVGGAMVLPATMSLINATFRGKDRSIAFAVWGSVIGGMAAVGPLLGGWLITDASWRWAFGINVPFGIAVIVAAFFTIRESRGGTSGRFDIVGTLLVVVAAGSLVFALIEGRTLGWWTTNHAPTIAGVAWPFAVSLTPFLFLIAALSTAGFIAFERRRARAGRSTLLPIELFSIRSFAAGNVVAALVSLGELGILFVLPLWMQNVLGYSALQTGSVLVALAIGSFLATGMVGGLRNRISPTGMLRLGIALELVGVLLIGLLLTTGLSWVVLAGALFVYGLGLGLASSQVTNVVLRDVPVERSGQASGTQSTARQIGSALGIAILGTVLFGVLSIDLGHRLAGDGIDDARAEKVVATVTDSAGAAIPGLQAHPATHALGQQAAQSLTTATSAAAYTGAGFLGIALLASIALGAPRRASTDITTKETISS